MEHIVRTAALAYNDLPRRHRVVLTVLTMLTLAVIIWRPVIYHRESDSAIKYIELNNRKINSLLPDASEPIEQISPNNDIPHDELDQKDASEKGKYEYVVSQGDTLSTILMQYGIDASDISLLASRHRALRNLKVGQQISWVTDEKNDLQHLTWEVSRRETRSYDRQHNRQFKETKKLQQSEWRDVVLSGRLQGTFVNSAKAAGLNSAEIRALTKALQWQLDFRKLRQGDKFSILVSRDEISGRSEQSRLLAVRMRSGGKDYYAFRAEDGNFYDRQGSGLARGFMRFPTVKQFRISSHFNPRRLHPLTARFAPHRGVDFSMPIGTPILAVGDGEILAAHRDDIAGHFVTIRHGRQYTTRYMHLNRILVKPGQKIKRGDRIALSGNSGRSTGPHLHYEFWVNQQPVNPLNMKLPHSYGLSGVLRKDYMELVKQTVPQLQFD